MKKHTLLKVMKIRSEEKLPEEKIYEEKSGYRTKTEVYANRGLDIRALPEISRSFSKINIASISEE